MTSYLWLAVTAIICLIIWEEIDEIIYVHRSRKEGFGIPFRKYSRPLGLVATYLTFQDVRHHRLGPKMQQLFNEIGKSTVRTQGILTKTIITVHPENIKAVLATNFKDFSLGSRHSQLFPLLGNGIFSLSGEGWKQCRALLRPQFTREQITDLDINYRHTNVLIDVCKRLSKQGDGVFDIQELFHELTLDTATELLFGKSVDSLKSSSDLLPGLNFTSAQVVKAINFSMLYLSKRFQLGQLGVYLNSKEFQGHVKVCKDFTNYFVYRALKQTESGYTSDRYVFIEELSKQTRDPIVIRDQALNILLAGQDTTSYALSCCLYRLGSHKDVFDKLREKILDKFGTTLDTITFDSLKRCSYLNHFINEVLRLHPAVPFNFREAIRDTSIPLGGGPDESLPVLIRKGEKVAYSTFLMQRCEEYWGPTAKEFRPERWEEDSPHTWEYLPFNGGPRICLGQQLALIETNYTLVRILQTFKSVTYIERGPVSCGDEPRMGFKLTGTLADGCWVKLEKA